MTPALKRPGYKLVDLFDIWTSIQLILLWLAIGITAWGLAAALPELRGTGLWWIGCLWAYYLFIHGPFATAGLEQRVATANPREPYFVVDRRPPGNPHQNASNFPGCACQR